MRQTNRSRRTQVTITAVYHRSGGWVSATVAGAVGCYAQGRTLAEARRALCDVVADVLELAPHQIPSTPGRAPSDAGKVERILVSA